MDSTRYLSFAGRLLIGLPFAMSGLGKLAAYGSTAAMIAGAGLPVPPLAFAVAVAVELGGGPLAGRWSPSSSGRNCVGTVLLGDGVVVPQQLC